MVTDTGECFYIKCAYFSICSDCGNNNWENKCNCPEDCLDERGLLEPKPGSCKAMSLRYYFNQEEKICKSFVWGGCGGVVPFSTLEECQEVCE